MLQMMDAGGKVKPEEKKVSDEDVVKAKKEKLAQQMLPVGGADCYLEDYWIVSRKGAMDIFTHHMEIPFHSRVALQDRRVWEMDPRYVGNTELVRFMNSA